MMPVEKPTSRSESSIETSLIEADVYAKQGLKDEAAAIYQGLLDRIDPAHKLADEIKSRLQNIKTSSRTISPSNMAK